MEGLEGAGRMRVGAEGDDVGERAAGTGWGVTPSDGSDGLKMRLEGGRWGVVRRFDTRGGLNSSWDWMIWGRQAF